MGKDLVSPKNKRKLNETEPNDVKAKKKKIETEKPINKEKVVTPQKPPTPNKSNKDKKNNKDTSKSTNGTTKTDNGKVNKVDSKKNEKSGKQNKTNNNTNSKTVNKKENNNKDKTNNKPNNNNNKKEANKKDTTTNSEVIPLDAPLFPSGVPDLTSHSEVQSGIEEKLKSSQFRYINEQLYTMTGDEAKELFEKNPELPEIYHTGYRRQVQQWPLNPLTKLIERVQSLPSGKVVADFGCGEAMLALTVGDQHTVHSFDLFKANDRVVQCEMSHVPLKDGSVDVVVFCLSLMGSNFKDFIAEANRVLKTGGLLLIAEVRSRFENFHDFIEFLVEAGFVYDKSNKRDKMFVWFEFHKSNRGFYSSKERAVALLKPCKYKKR